MAAGPCIELWGDPTARFPEHSAWVNWRAARDQWMRAHGLKPVTDYRHLPRVLHDRAPYFRNEDTSPS